MPIPTVWGLFVSKSIIQLQDVVKQRFDEGDLILKVCADWVEDNEHYLWICGFWMHTGEVPGCRGCCLWCDRGAVVIQPRHCRLTGMMVAVLKQDENYYSTTQLLFRFVGFLPFLSSKNHVSPDVVKLNVCDKLKDDKENSPRFSAR